MAILTPDEKLEQWKPIVLTKLLGKKKYNFTVEGTKDANTIRLVVYAPNRLKDQPKFEEELSELSLIKSNNLSWKSSSSKTGSRTVTPIEVTLKNKKYFLVFKPLSSDPGNTSSADKTGKLTIKLKPSEIKSLTTISLKTAVPDEIKRKSEYFKKDEKEKGDELYPIEITNKWLTPEQIIRRTKYYLHSKSSETKKDGTGKSRKGLNLPKEVLTEFDELFNRVMDGNSTYVKVNLRLSPASAEFFEVLSAVKLSMLMRAKNKYILNDVLFLPEEDIKGVIVPKIFIPKASNFPLLDYYISIKKLTGNHEIDTKNAIKISVKSHISSPTVDTNTVKLDQVFHSEQDLIKWYSGIKSTGVKTTQSGPKEVVESALKMKNFSGTKPMFPIETISKFLSGPRMRTTEQEIVNVLLSFGQKRKNAFQSKTYSRTQILNAIIKTIKIIGPNLQRFKKETLLSDAGIKKQDLVIMTEVFRNVLSTPDVKPEQVGITVQNLAFICERILAAGSHPTSNLKLNFYKMFYDMVLTKYKIAYAMPTINKKGGDTVQFKYLAVRNWNKEYEQVKKEADQYWISLRGKSGTNKVADAIGLSV
jgi:hypothetical protein